jgi:polysaccharide deacetylase family protein (PEP-CTERM system associated)
MKILTFDIEDWFNLLDIPATANVADWDRFEPRIHANVERLLETIGCHGQRATFFCLGWVAEKYPEIIRMIDEAGYEVASHTHTHQLVYEQTPEQFRNDVARSIDALENITGKKVKSFRAPGFSITPDTPWAFETLIELGIEYDSSVFPAARGHGGFADFGAARPAIIECESGLLKEFPISLGKLLGRNLVFSGGGYFRLLPYTTISRLTRQSDYIMTYFHPRDFDADQPVLDLPLHRRFKSYVGLRGAHSKFERWLGEYAFIDLRQAVERVAWDSAPRISIA